MSKPARADHSEDIGERHYRSLARIEPRPKTIYCSQGRVVLATDLDGLIGTYPRHGLFAYETRVLSRYRYYVNGCEPQRVVVSNVEQHSWLGYYISPLPGLKWKEDTGSGEMEPAVRRNPRTESVPHRRAGRPRGHRFHELHAGRHKFCLRNRTRRRLLRPGGDLQEKAARQVDAGVGANCRRGAAELSYRLSRRATNIPTRATPVQREFIAD